MNPLFFPPRQKTALHKQQGKHWTSVEVQLHLLSGTGLGVTSVCTGSYKQKSEMYTVHVSCINNHLLMVIQKYAMFVNCVIVQYRLPKEM